MKALMGIIIVSTTAWTAGCLDRELKPLNPCLVSGSTKQISVTNIDKVDLLFVVDDSPSMVEEQGAIRAQIPRMINTLVTGMRTPNDPNPFPPAKDLHLGVVSVNMGLVGIQGIGGCSGVTGVTSMQPGFGDDGILRSVPPPGQRFLSYTAGGPVSAAQLATNFTCLALTGTNGCGFEQQLEEPLKALWPSIDTCASGAGCDANNKHYKQGEVITPGRVTFLTDTAHPNLALGHGDLENKGFVRNSQLEGLSLIGILLFTDEEDCSSKTTVHFTPQMYLQPSDPLYNQDLNLRCFYNPNNLYGVDRYINGFKALRAGNENLVVFATITGVPADLVDDNAYKSVNWDDDAQRDAFYQHILTDQRMIPKPDPSRMPGDGNLTPSCVTVTSTATPPQRIVEVAKGFGKNGLVKSICELSQFPPAMDAIINIIAKQLGAVCLDRPLVRAADGKVTCKVVWELPQAGMGPPTTPTQCNQRPFLAPPDPTQPQTNDKGGQNCIVNQLAVMNNTIPVGTEEGWYYDNFSPEVKKTCISGTQRAAYTANAKPPTGVTVKLECLNQTQTVISNRTDLDPAFYNQQIKAPDIGTECDKDAMGKPVSGDAAKNQVCWVNTRPASGPAGIDKRMFCHPQLNTCVRTCSGETDCPPAWVCDKRDTTLLITKAPICVNPTCGQ
jgi:hypothetical protein